MSGRFRFWTCVPQVKSMGWIGTVYEREASKRYIQKRPKGTRTQRGDHIDHMKASHLTIKKERGKRHGQKGTSGQNCAGGHVAAFLKRKKRKVSHMTRSSSCQKGAACEQVHEGKKPRKSKLDYPVVSLIFKSKKRGGNTKLKLETVTEA